MSVLEQKRPTIEQLAEEILKKYGIQTAPVDPLIVAELEGVKVFNADFANPSIAGMIRKSEDEINIYVKKADIPQRKRFTLAHELGHLFLHLNQQDGNFMDNEISIFRGANQNPIEVEANSFAAALLMPRDLVIEASYTCASVEEMASIFNVSQQAMRFRMKELGIL